MGIGFDSRIRDIKIGTTTVIVIVSFYIAWNIYKGNKPWGAVAVTE